MNAEKRLRNMIKTLFNFINRCWRSFTQGFDKFVIGTVLKKLFIFTCIFTICFLGFWAYCEWCHPEYSGWINREIEGMPRAIAAQMLDPGNQHMVGPDEFSEPDTSSANGKENSNKDNRKPLNDKDKRGLKLFAFIVTVTGTLIYSGLMISTFFSVFEQRSATVRDGLMNYHYRKHVIILGANSISIGLIRQLLNADIRKIVMLSSREATEVRRALASELSAGQMKKVVVLYGDRASMKDLSRLCLRQAKSLFIIGEDNEPDHDSRSNASLKMIEIILKEHNGYKKEGCNNKSKVLECNILFESQTTYAAHQIVNFQEINDKGKREPSPVIINAFSFYEKWAQKVMVGCRHNSITYDPLDFEPIAKDSDKYVHLVIAGMTRMGFALGVEAAQHGHFANFERKKTRITFIDSDADREMNFFASRYQPFCNAVDVSYTDLFTGNSTFKKGTLPFIDVELEFVKAHFESPELRQNLVEWTSDDNALTTIAICFNKPSNCLAAGLYLPKEVYKENVRILVQQETEHSMLSLMYPDETKVRNIYKYVKPFGMTNDCIDLSLHKDFKAKAVNYFYYHKNSLPGKLEDVFKVMDSDWYGLRERFKWSSRYSAESIKTKLRAIGAGNTSPSELNPFFTPGNIELLARIEHARWNAYTLLSDLVPPSEEEANKSTETANLVWDSYIAGDRNEENPDYNEKKRTHDDYVNKCKWRLVQPCLVPFDELSEYYKDIDRRLVECIPLIEKEFATNEQKRKNSRKQA